MALLTTVSGFLLSPLGAISVTNPRTKEIDVSLLDWPLRPRRYLKTSGQQYLRSLLPGIRRRRQRGPFRRTGERLPRTLYLCERPFGRGRSPHRRRSPAYSRCVVVILFHCKYTVYHRYQRDWCLFALNEQHATRVRTRFAVERLAANVELPKAVALRRTTHFNRGARLMGTKSLLATIFYHSGPTLFNYLFIYLPF